MSPHRLVFIGLLLLGSVPAPAPAEEASPRRQYGHHFVGITFYVPQDWYLGFDTVPFYDGRDMTRCVELRDPALERITAAIPGHVMFVASERALGADTSVSGPNVIAVAINSRGLGGGAGSAERYLRDVATGMRKKPEVATVSEVSTVELAKRTFRRLDSTWRSGSAHVSSSQFARVTSNEYLLVLNLTADSADALARLVDTVDRNTVLWDVSPIQDTGDWAEAFRRSATIEARPSLGRTIAKWGGIGLFVLGLLWLAAVAGRRR